MTDRFTRNAMHPPIQYRKIDIPGCVFNTDLDDQGIRQFDNSGNGIIGLNSGPITIAGYAGYIKQFDGVDDQINFGKSASLGNLTKMSVSTWFKRKSLGGGGLARHIDKTKWLLYCTSPNRIQFQRFFSAGNGYWSANTPVYTDRWYHIVITYNSSAYSNVPVFYINGAISEVTTSVVPAGSAISDIGDDLIIGNNPVLNRGFDGWMGSIQIYNRILTGHEALILYQNSAWKYGLPA